MGKEIHELYEGYKTEYQKKCTPALNMIEELERELNKAIDNIQSQQLELKNEFDRKINEKTKEFSSLRNRLSEINDKVSESKKELIELPKEIEREENNKKYQEGMIKDEERINGPESKEKIEKILIKIKSIDEEINMLENDLKEANAFLESDYPSECKRIEQAMEEVKKEKLKLNVESELNKPEFDKKTSELAGEIEKIKGKVKELNQFKKNEIVQLNSLIINSYEVYVKAEKQTDKIKKAMVEKKIVELPINKASIKYENEDSFSVANNKDLNGMLYFSNKAMSESELELNTKIPSAAEMLANSHFRAEVSAKCEKISKEYGLEEKPVMKTVRRENYRRMNSEFYSQSYYLKKISLMLSFKTNTR